MKRGFKKIIGTDQSAGEILSSLLPKDAKLAKALGTLGVASCKMQHFRNQLRQSYFMPPMM